MVQTHRQQKPWLRPLFVAVVGLGVSGFAFADPCAPLVARIGSQMAAKGITDHRLTVVPIDAEADGKVVGWCDARQRKVVYRRAGSTAARMVDPVAERRPPVASVPVTTSPPAASVPQRVQIQIPTTRQVIQPGTRWPVITECRDGSVIVQGDCPG